MAREVLHYIEQLLFQHNPPITTTLFTTLYPHWPFLCSWNVPCPFSVMFLLIILFVNVDSNTLHSLCLSLLHFSPQLGWPNKILPRSRYFWEWKMMLLIFTQGQIGNGYTVTWSPHSQYLSSNVLYILLFIFFHFLVKTHNEQGVLPVWFFSRFFFFFF